MDDEVFLAHLNKYPALRKRMEEILNVADDAEGVLIESNTETIKNSCCLVVY